LRDRVHEQRPGTESKGGEGAGPAGQEGELGRSSLGSA
jgi:hypothetical protein